MICKDSADATHSSNCCAINGVRVSRCMHPCTNAPRRFFPLLHFFFFQVCECLGLEWGKTIPQQFDNVAVALLTLFEISTTEAWTAVTYAAVDSTEEDMQPIRGNVVWRVWFFILFMLVGAYLVVNLFVGVVVDNFKKVGWFFIFFYFVICSFVLRIISYNFVHFYRKRTVRKQWHVPSSIRCSNKGTSRAAVSPRSPLFTLSLPPSL